MMLGVFLLLAKLARSKGETRFAFLEKIGDRLKLAILAVALLTTAYIAETRSIMALQFSQSLFELIP